MKLILSENQFLRYLSFTIFYIAQGLPFGFGNVALPAYLAEQGVEPGKIAAFIGVVQLPWTFKLIAGPLMDRITYLAMGRRRPWVLAAQVLLVLVSLGFLFIPDGLNNLVMLTALCFLLNCCTAVQDVAVDGMAIDVLPKSEHGRANSFMAFGQVAGIAGSGIISAFFLQSYGLPGVAMFFVLGFGLILMWGVLVRERANEKLLPWTVGQASAHALALQADSWSSIVKKLFKVLFLPASLLLMMASFLFRLADGLWLALSPVVAVQQLGYASTTYSSWTSAAGFTAALIGLALGSFIDKKGIKRAYALGMLGYGLVALAVGLMESAWTNQNFVYAVGILQPLFYQVVFISFIAIHMSLCWDKVSATQFALYMAWVNIARSGGSSALAFLNDGFSYPQMFVVIGILFLVAVILLWKVDLSKHQQRVALLDSNDRE